MSLDRDTTIKAIGPNDIITSRGQYLYHPDGTRFFMKGIAFPVPQHSQYNSTSWIEILHQLNSHNLEYNTVRVYYMDPTVDYSEFFHAAARFGVYVIIPLTSRSGNGVLDRNRPAPKCYTRALFEYGVASIQNYMQYSNVLAGLLGNEVMNSRESWVAAPCIRAYGRDLKLYMKQRNMRPLPLLYAAQHSGIGGSGAVGTMWLTMNYLTCTDKYDNDGGNVGGIMATQPPVDIFGVNIESWCSSIQTFTRNEDGSAGSYYSLWLGLHQSAVPLVFTEMGCSRRLFDRENGLRRFAARQDIGTRDWHQVKTVLHDMSDTWSGFCAYSYDGDSEFNMFEGGPWSEDPLVPTQDFWNFRERLREEALRDSKEKDEDDDGPPDDFERFFAPTCSQIEEDLKSCCDIELYPYNKIPSYELSQTRSTINGTRIALQVKQLQVSFGLDEGGLLLYFNVLFVAGIFVFVFAKTRRRAQTSGDVSYEQID